MTGIVIYYIFVKLYAGSNANMYICINNLSCSSKNFDFVSMLPVHFTGASPINTPANNKRKGGGGESSKRD